MGSAWTRMHLMSGLPDYEPTPDSTVAARASALGVRPEVVALDHMLENGGKAMLYVPFLNYAEGNLDGERIESARGRVEHKPSVDADAPVGPCERRTAGGRLIVTLEHTAGEARELAEVDDFGIAREPRIEARRRVNVEVKEPVSQLRSVALGSIAPM